MDVHISWYSDANAKLQPGSNVTRGKEALTQVGARLVLDCSANWGGSMLRHHSEGALTSVQYTSIHKYTQVHTYTHCVLHKYTQVIREGFDKCAVEFREARALCS